MGLSQGRYNSTLPTVPDGDTSAIQIDNRGRVITSASGGTGTTATESKGAFQTVTLQSAATATGNGTTINTSGMGAMNIAVTGTFVGTVTFEYQDAVGGWNAVMLQASGSATLSSTATSASVWRAFVGGFSGFRARISAYTSGSITVTAFAENTANTPSVQNGSLYTSLDEDIDSITVYDKEYTYTSVTADAVISAVPVGFCGYYVAASASGVVSFYDNASAASGTAVGALSQAVTANQLLLLETPIAMANGIYFDLVSGTATVLALTRKKVAA